MANPTEQPPTFKYFQSLVSDEQLEAILERISGQAPNDLIDYESLPKLDLTDGSLIISSMRFNARKQRQESTQRSIPLPAPAQFQTTRVLEAMINTHHLRRYRQEHVIEHNGGKFLVKLEDSTIQQDTPRTEMTYQAIGVLLLPPEFVGKEVDGFTVSDHYPTHIDIETRTGLVNRAKITGQIVTTQK